VIRITHSGFFLTTYYSSGNILNCVAESMSSGFGNVRSLSNQKIDSKDSRAVDFTLRFVTIIKSESTLNL
jgi:hypothetical protein